MIKHSSRHFFTANIVKDLDDLFYLIRMSILRFIDAFYPTMFPKFWKFRMRVAQFIEVIRNSDYRESFRNNGIFISTKHRQYFVPNIIKDSYEFEDMMFEVLCKIGALIKIALLSPSVGKVGHSGENEIASKNAKEACFRGFP